MALDVSFVQLREEIESTQQTLYDHTVGGKRWSRRGTGRWIDEDRNIRDDQTYLDFLVRKLEALETLYRSLTTAT